MVSPSICNCFFFSFFFFSITLKSMSFLNFVKSIFPSCFPCPLQAIISPPPTYLTLWRTLCSIGYSPDSFLIQIYRISTNNTKTIAKPQNHKPQTTTQIQSQNKQQIQILPSLSKWTPQPCLAHMI